MAPSVDAVAQDGGVPKASPAGVTSKAPGLSLHLDRVSVRHPGASSPAHSALLDVELQIGSGEHVAVVGPSGAGKTTLLHVAAAALRASRGRVLLDGEEPWSRGPSGRRRLRQRLFLAPQVPPLPPRQRVVTAVLAGGLPAMGLTSSLLSLLYPLDVGAAHEALAPFDLENRLFDRVDRLSGGERQRVSLARALLAPARLWLLDEPLSALDPVRAARVLQVLRQRALQRGVTLIVSMHQVEMALAHFPRLIGLRAGTVRFDSAAPQISPEQLRSLYEQPGPTSVARDRIPEETGEAPPVPMVWR